MLQIPDILAYVKRPVLRAEREKFTPYHLWQLVTLCVFIAIFVSIVLSYFFAAMGIENPATAEELAREKWTPRELLTIIVIAPIVEELIFRSWLGNKKSIIYFFPAFLLLVLIFGLILVKYDAVATALWISLLATDIYIISLWRKGFRPVHQRLSDAYFPYIFWSSAIIFGLIHVGNFPSGYAFPVLVLMVMPQMIAGFVLGYTRIRFGLMACILLHGFYNATVTLLGNMLT